MDPTSGRPNAQVLCFAHRGASGYVSGNTLEAFLLALRQGATALESDVHLSADGVPVLVHDSTVGLRRLPVASLSADRLSTEYKVPSLETLYRTCGTNFDFSLDIKPTDPPVRDACAEAVVAVLRKVGGAAEGHLWVCHSDTAFLVAFRDRTAFRGKLVLSTRTKMIEGNYVKCTKEAASLGVHVVNMPHYEWSREAVMQAKANGVLVFAWDTHTKERLRSALAMGVDGVYCNFPDIMLETVKNFHT
ncbi:glycerophosphodiester phosphodiesterase [Pelomyxa schiedti]|nr:glycerophosphodiester phosphodiesterase [Pelomyxa schiedti]